LLSRREEEELSRGTRRDGAHGERGKEEEQAFVANIPEGRNPPIKLNLTHKIVISRQRGAGRRGKYYGVHLRRRRMEKSINLKGGIKAQHLF